MRCDEIRSWKDALFQAASVSDGTPPSPRFPYAMIQTYSRLFLGVNPLTDRENRPEDWVLFLQTAERIEQSLLEARFFSVSEEIRIFRESGSLRAVLLAEEKGDRYLEETCEIANGKKFGGSVTVRRVIGFDEDGQAQVVLTRLSGWKEAENHG